MLAKSKSGKSIAAIIKPTITAKKTIMIGSIKDVIR